MSIVSTSTNVWHLPTPQTSIFNGRTCREYPTRELMYGFINSGMGVKICNPQSLKWFSNEEQKILKYMEQSKAEHYEVKYNCNTYGRIEPPQGLSLSKFHRPIRHAFCQDVYVDFDIKTCHPVLLTELCKKSGLECQAWVDYSKNSKAVIAECIEHYQLEDVSKNGARSYDIAKGQAKRLFISLIYGGGAKSWRKDCKISATIQDMPCIKAMCMTIRKVMPLIWESNPHMVASFEDYFIAKEAKAVGNEKGVVDDYQRMVSLTSFYFQTKERIIQENAVKLLLKQGSQFRIEDIVPCQDGFMVLKSKLDSIKFDDFVFAMNNNIENDVQVEWLDKPFDEADKNIVPSQINPVLFSLKDLKEDAEFGIANKLASVLKPNCKFDKIAKEDHGDWYYYNSDSCFWEKTKPNNYVVGIMHGQLDNLIRRAEQSPYVLKPTTDDEKTSNKERKTLLTALRQQKNIVCKAGFLNQLFVFLQELLHCEGFAKRLDNCTGFIPYINGMLNLKTGVFRAGRIQTDYLTYTIKFNYSIKVDSKGIAFVKSVLLRILNNNENDLEYYLSTLGYALTGLVGQQKHIWYFVDGTENSKGDNGKSLFMKVLSTLLPEYVYTTKNTFFDEKNEKKHKQLIKMKCKRLVWADEGTTNAVDEAFMKAVVDGGLMENEILYGSTEMIDIQFKFFCLSNHVPQIKEESLYNRYLQVPFKSHFDRTGERYEEDASRCEFIADVNLMQVLLDNYSEAIVQLMISYAVKYGTTKNLPPLPSSVRKATMDCKASNDSFATMFLEHFDIGESLRLSKHDITEFLTSINFDKSKNITKEMKRMGFAYDRDLKGFDEIQEWDKSKKMYVSTRPRGGFKGCCLRKTSIGLYDMIEEDF